MKWRIVCGYRESYVDKIVDRGLEKPKCVKSGKFIYTLYMA